jgi:hypothetical protein
MYIYSYCQYLRCKIDVNLAREAFLYTWIYVQHANLIQKHFHIPLRCQLATKP